MNCECSWHVGNEIPPPQECVSWKTEVQKLCCWRAFCAQSDWLWLQWSFGVSEVFIHRANAWGWVCVLCELFYLFILVMQIPGFCTIHMTPGGLCFFFLPASLEWLRFRSHAWTCSCFSVYNSTYTYSLFWTLYRVTVDSPWDLENFLSRAERQSGRGCLQLLHCHAGSCGARATFLYVRAICSG